LKRKVADCIALQNARKASHKPRPTGIFREFPETFELVCKTLKGVRDAGQPLDGGIIQGIMQGCIQQSAPEMFQRTVMGKRGEDVKFSVSKTFGKAFVRKHLGWTWRRVTIAASKRPEDWETGRLGQQPFASCTTSPLSWLSILIRPPSTCGPQQSKLMKPRE
jgi:hypothetical protein